MWNHYWSTYYCIGQHIGIRFSQEFLCINGITVLLLMEINGHCVIDNYVICICVFGLSTAHSIIFNNIIGYILFYFIIFLHIHILSSLTGLSITVANAML